MRGGLRQALARDEPLNEPVDEVEVLPVAPFVSVEAGELDPPPISEMSRSPTMSMPLPSCSGP